MTAPEKVDELRAMEPWERVEVLRRYIRSTGQDSSALAWAVKVAQPGGWQHLAPAWVDIPED